MTGRLANNPYVGLRFPTANYSTSGGRTNHPLNTLYTYGSAGAAIGFRYQARDATPIDELYVMIDAGAGTLANINLACDIRNEHATSATQPGTTVRATATNAAYGATSAPKWVQFVFPTPYTPAVGETLWLIVRNVAAAPATDFPSILCTFNAAPAFNLLLANHSAYSTVNGFSTAGTLQGRAPFVVRQGGKSFGFAVTVLDTAVFAATNTLRGFQMTPPVDIEVSGWMTAVPNGVMTSIRIYDAATPPAGSPLHTFNLGSDAGQSRDELIGAKFWPPVILNGGTAYNVVTAWASAQAIGGGTIQDYVSFPTIFDDLTDGFVDCFSVADVGGVWTLNKASRLNQQLIVSDLIAPAASVRRPKVWNGLTWQEKPMGVWNGSTWEERPLKIWDGGAWV